MIQSFRFVLLSLVSLSLVHTGHAQPSPPPSIRAGMIGLDTSHVPAFVGIFNSAKATGGLAGIRAVAGSLAESIAIYELRIR